MIAKELWSESGVIVWFAIVAFRLLGCSGWICWLLCSC